jgi:hypothetical protein
VVIWAAVGLVLGSVAALADIAAPAVSVRALACLAAAAYGLCYGLLELSGRAWPPPPGRRWQVPQELVIATGDRRRVLIWGAILGPGWLTRNPYAGFGLLPLLCLSAGDIAGAVVLAALIGAAHGCGRALALLRDARSAPSEPFALLLMSVRWRTTDGFALLLVAGTALAVGGHLLRSL